MVRQVAVSLSHMSKASADKESLSKIDSLRDIRIESRHCLTAGHCQDTAKLGNMGTKRISPFSLPGGALIVAALLFSVGAYIFAQRLDFLDNSKVTEGAVTSVRGFNTNKKSGLGKSGIKGAYDYTLFRATVEFRPEGTGARFFTVVDAGEAGGHNRNISEAGYRIGDKVRIAYDPANPSEARRDNPVTLSFLPIFVFFMATMFLALGLVGVKVRNSTRTRRRMSRDPKAIRRG